MAKTAPQAIAVDEAVADWILDPQPARTWVLLEQWQRQHALATAWGGPGRWVSMNADEGDTVTALVRVPPGVTEMDFTLLVSGYGELDITSTNDSTGSQVYWLTPGDTLAQSMFVSTTGVHDSSEGAATARAITVSGSTSWTWQTERVTFTIASGGPGTIHGFLARPIHVAR